MTTTDDDTTERVASLSDEALAAEKAAIEAEAQRRATVRDAERRTDDQLIAFLQAAGRENGAPYEPPVGLVGAYPTGWRVQHEGKTFEAVVPGARMVPPGDEWTEIDPDTPLVDFWQPGPYEAGAQVRDAGRTWTATSDVDGPRPSDFPGGWDLTN